ncbi:ATPase [Aliiroseovarius sp. KMU-50]|uniref:ATPase n=1 Tax=Aliiroseovarius salicola TaxID=3009082 RepID=A0ABT4W4Z7_9RHOB|nr:BadF/BadG/BcrA/BcrD ATPase family protein [Aliiroseovarius sp. KMU-50]MDA5095595.1 ATPase [Aliiroseovarius sp. KMU-50]
MTVHTPLPFLAVDGGGTRCRLALCDSTGKIHVFETGSANVTTDFSAAAREIRRGIEGVSQISGLEPEAISALPAYFGLAGITGPDNAAEMANALPFTHIRVEDDRPAALSGVLGGHDGMVAHCGTGSFIAAQDRGQMRFIGGWGPVLGDMASAQWVGRRALARCLDVVDGLAQPSPLSDHILNERKGSAGIVRFAASASPADFGRYAPLVTRHAAKGCALSIGILQDAANQIAATLTKIGWTEGTRLCLTGGIGPCYAPYLPAPMQATLHDPEGTPLDGAILLARRFAAELAELRLSNETNRPCSPTRMH